MHGRGALLLVANRTGTGGKSLRKCSYFGCVGRLGGGLSRSRAIQVCIHAGNAGSTVPSKFCHVGRRRAIQVCIQVCIHAGNADSVVPSKFCLFGHQIGE